jgi:hypothetical protein
MNGRTLLLAAVATAFNFFSIVTAQCYYGLSTPDTVSFCEKQTTTGCSNGVTQAAIGWLAVSGGSSTDVGRFAMAFADDAALADAKRKLESLGFSCRPDTKYTNPNACKPFSICGTTIAGQVA